MRELLDQQVEEILGLKAECDRCSLLSPRRPDFGCSPTGQYLFVKNQAHWFTRPIVGLEFEFITGHKIAHHTDTKLPNRPGIGLGARS
jgi:hypothetical protein